jgi:hypothetical protein
MANTGTFLAPFLIAPTLISGYVPNVEAQDRFEYVDINPSSTAALAEYGRLSLLEISKSARPTYESERTIAQLRSWGGLRQNWDGENSNAPSKNSINDAISFLMLLNKAINQPEPSILASGNVSLVWENDQLYGEIEFLGKSSLAYFIKTESGRHKGVINFEAKKMPDVFETLLNI